MFAGKITVCHLKTRYTMKNGMLFCTVQFKVSSLQNILCVLGCCVFPLVDNRSINISCESPSNDPRSVIHDQRDEPLWMICDHWDESQWIICDQWAMICNQGALQNIYSSGEKEGGTQTSCKKSCKKPSQNHRSQPCFTGTSMSFHRFKDKLKTSDNQDNCHVRMNRTHTQTSCEQLML